MWSGEIEVRLVNFELRFPQPKNLIHCYWLSHCVIPADRYIHRWSWHRLPADRRWHSSRRVRCHRTQLEESTTREERPNRLSRPTRMTAVNLSENIFEINQKLCFESRNHDVWLVELGGVESNVSFTNRWVLHLSTRLCKCKVNERLQSTFLDAFHVKSSKKILSAMLSEAETWKL